jgi:ABC-type dipeptide/oligopeptide/nickel transport system permease component
MAEQEVLRFEEQVSFLDKIRGFFGNRIVVYIIRRVLVMIPMFLGISILTFIMVRAMGNPEDLFIGSGQNIEATRAAIRRQYGLDKPYYRQYLIWLENFLNWDFGYSGVFKTNNPYKEVNLLIYHTARLQYIALFLSVIISIPLGVQAAKSRGKTMDTVTSAFALLGLSMPIYVSGYLLIVTFGGGGLDWFPVKGAYKEFRPEFRDEFSWDRMFNDTDYMMSLLLDNLKDSAWHLVLPLIALTFVQLALITRLVRSSMLEVLGQDYILAARANGLDERTIIWKHAMRNAVIPVITFVGISVGTALAGAPITETVFSWPGLGRRYVTAITLIDMSMILGITMIITVLILLSNLLADILYVIVDPRITV